METDVKLKVVGQPGQPCLKERLDRDRHDRSRPEDQRVAVGWPQDPAHYCKGRAQDAALARMSALAEAGGPGEIREYLNEFLPEARLDGAAVGAAGRA